MRLLAGIAALVLIAGTPQNAPPTASFTRSPFWAPPPMTVNVDATASADGDGTIVAYDWDFGDTTTGTGVTASHLYSATGTYRITLTVTDNMGATAVTTRDVDCITASNLPPTLSVGAYPTLGTAPLDAQFESLVHDNSGTHTEIWDAGDGSPPAMFTNVPNHAGTLFSHTYAAAGTYVCTNRSMDSEGIWREFTTSVTVTASSTEPPRYGRRACGFVGIEALLLLLLIRRRTR